MRFDTTRTITIASTMLAAFLVGCAPDATRPVVSRAMAHAASAVPAPSQSAADAISSNVQRLHTPYGSVIDPRFVTGDSTSPLFTTLASNGYTRAGDAAIWTGHYLAAEAIHYQVTQSASALANVRRTLSAITTLVDVTGLNELARFAIPTGSPYASSITQEESHNGIYTRTLNRQPYYWVGNTSRDQYSGVMLGLAVAYDMVPDASVRTQISTLVTRLVGQLLSNGWNVIMPNFSISTTFLGRPDQQLSFLQVARHVNPTRFAATYASYRTQYSALVGVPIASECSDTYGSYFKFNLDYINLFDLIRLEESTSLALPSYRLAYATLRGCTGSHQNAAFDAVDRALRGPDATRDAELVNVLGLWLLRARRDYAVDLRAWAQANGYGTTCGPNGDEACKPIPVDRRPNTDYLWQRSPFGLVNTGAGTIETAAIDYLLPYWFARYYRVLTG